MMFWNRNKKDKATIANEKKRFNHLLSVAEKLPVKALPDLIRAIVRPVQSDFLLAVAEEGTDARPDMTPQEFFFKGLTQIQSYEKMKECEMNGADYPLSLASDIVLPWPWSLPGVSLDIENYCTLRLLFNQSLVLDKVPEYGKPAKCCSP